MGSVAFSQQAFDHSALRELERTLEPIAQVDARIEAQKMINRGGEVPGCDSVRGGVGRVAVGRSKRHPLLNSTAGK